MSYKREQVPLKSSDGVIEFISLQTNDQNSLTGPNMKELDSIMKEIMNDDNVKVAAFTSENPKFFCNGLDAENVLNTPDDKLLEEVGGIVILFGELLKFTKPLITEVTGYAMGGGAVLTVASDFKYMIEGKARIAFTEVLVGLPLPKSFIDKIRLTVHPPYVNRMCLEGANYKADEAKAIGLIDETAPDKEGLRQLTLKKAEALAKIPMSAYQATKIEINRPVLDDFEASLQRLAASFEKEVVRYNMKEAMTALKEKRRPKLR